MPEVTIIIPHRHLRLEWLKEAKESIANQTFKSYEVIEAVGEDENKMSDAIKEAHGEYILMLSDDDKLPPNFLEVTVPLMFQKDIVSTGLQNFGDETVLNYGDKIGRHMPGPHPFFSSLFRKSLHEKAGGFDYDIGAMGDAEFWWRCFKEGARWIKTADTFYYYRKHRDQQSAILDYAESRRKVLAKHPDYPW